MIDYQDTSLEDIDRVMENAAAAFVQYRKLIPEQKALFLEAIASEIEAMGDELLHVAAAETNLPLPRLLGERGRTTYQLRMFAEMVREGSWVNATIDKAKPDRIPIPKPDIRQMLYPLGPVVVFGASNFPFAYSTAGGDTASALAAGCPVVIKCHPAHAETSTMVFEAIKKAAGKTNLPANVVQHVYGASASSGEALVKHPDAAAVGFTGSFTGGTALYHYAQQRKSPIPVFSEMGSVNPAIFLPDTLTRNAASLATMYAQSITQGMGQFCTNPGLMIAIDDVGTTSFLESLSAEIGKVLPAKMLHEGIQRGYNERMEKAISQDGVMVVKRCEAIPAELEALPVIASVTGEAFLKNPFLHEEVFGPYSLMVKCTDIAELKMVWKSLSGQLTTSLMGTTKDFDDHPGLVAIAEDIAGRIVFNSVPTGVEVCESMVHSGPFPACTDSRYTAVGIHAVKRWVRPVCYQNCPDELLPAELKESNPLNISRKVNE